MPDPTSRVSYPALLPFRFQNGYNSLRMAVMCTNYFELKLGAVVHVLGVVDSLIFTSL